MRHTDITVAQTVTVAIRGMVVDRLTFRLGEQAEEYKANVRRWSREKRVQVTIWTQAAAAAAAAEAEHRGATAIAV